jgi:hypothetical protein
MGVQPDFMTRFKETLDEVSAMIERTESASESIRKLEVGRNAMLRQHAFECDQEIHRTTEH